VQECAAADPSLWPASTAAGQAGTESVLLVGSTKEEAKIGVAGACCAACKAALIAVFLPAIGHTALVRGNCWDREGDPPSRSLFHALRPIARSPASRLEEPAEQNTPIWTVLIRTGRFTTRRQP
jgi:hypothetical protein